MNQKKNCETCGNFDLPICIACTSKYDEPPTKWVPSEQYEPMTNADRIRNMSDEELAEFLYEYRFCDMCEEGCEECRYHGDCERRLTDWLKQPCECVQERATLCKRGADRE